MTGVMMRIFSFSLVSWLGPASPFMFVWIFNTIDAVMLSWCSMLKKDAASLRTAAVNRGMKTLREAGLDKVRAGETSLEEVLRVTQEEL